MIAVAAASLLIGSGIGAGLMALTTDRPVAAVAAATQEPAQSQPSEHADRQTCAGWDASGKLINQAADVLAVIPAGTSILAPEVRSDPGQRAAVQQAGSLFQSAADGLRQAITPGATPVLAQTSLTTADALAALATTYLASDESSGDAITTARTAAHGLSVLCKRLVH